MAANLTDSHARNAKPKERPYKLTDGHRLFLLVKPNGKKSWRYRYRIGGGENMFAIGDYPQLGLKQARESRDQARALVKNGIHPAAHRKAERLVGALAAGAWSSLATPASLLTLPDAIAGAETSRPSAATVTIVYLNIRLLLQRLAGVTSTCIGALSMPNTVIVIK